MTSGSNAQESNAQEMFRDAGLTFPEFPDDLAGALAPVSEWVLSTRSDAPGPYGIEWFVAESCTEDVEDYLLVGQDGHGINSYAMHYYLVRRPLALFVQSAWGGAYMDRDESAQAVEVRFDLARQLAEAAAGAPFEPDERLVVVESDFHGSRWARLTVPADEVGAIGWNMDDDAMTSALASLEAAGDR